MIFNSHQTSTPIVSIIVPVYKVEQYVRKCIDSILSQTFTDFELVLIDDGSPDNCPIICDEYALKDNRIHVIHQKNGGISAARNAGLDYVFASSNSKWITFIDSDDWVLSDYLAELYAAVVTTGTKASICYMGSSNNTNDEKKTSSNLVLSFEDLYNNKNTKLNPVSAWGKLYKKELFENVRYSVGKICEDLYITHQVLFKCDEISVVERELYIYFTDNESITRSAWGKRRFDEIDASEKLISFMSDHHLPKAKSAAIKRYIYVLHNQLNMIDSDSFAENYKIERKIIQKKMGKALIKYKQDIPFLENRWHYDAAFPQMMGLYWFIVEKLKKK